MLYLRSVDFNLFIKKQQIRSAAYLNSFVVLAFLLLNHNYLLHNI
ncbi:hypothetical protein J671_3136 [Acinetobacter sp. 1130196]|nr:hypothetical protein J671_3136 [Acinetobacter sp. 1130196]